MVFNPDMHLRALRRLDVEAELRRAIEREEFRLHYQPIVEVGSGRIAGFEALIRWAHPERGLLGPVEFISVAEETGLIRPIGRWVMEEAAHQAPPLAGAVPGRARPDHEREPRPRAAPARRA